MAPVGATVALLCVVFMVACASAPPPSPSPPSPAPAGLDGREFLSTSIMHDGIDRPLVAGTRIRLTFREGQLGAHAGCNHLGAAYVLNENGLVLGSLSTTDMGCDPPRHAQDEWLAGFLTATPTVTLDGATLTLEGGGTVMTLLDREVADPDVELVGPLWVLDAIVTGDAVSSVPAGVVASLRFNAEGWVEVDTGCNTGGGSYAADEATITFAPIGLTRIACMGPAGEVERVVLDALTADRLDYAIDARSLTLGAGELSLILRAAD
jgi:heat shock protein HslJ